MSEQKCQDCGDTVINDDDRRWNNNKNTIYCRECVHQPVFDARSEVMEAKTQLQEAEERLEEEQKIASDKAKEVARVVGTYRPISYTVRCDD